MKIIRPSLPALAGLFLIASAHAASLTENFSDDPSAHGWSIYGDTSLFRWNPTNQNLEVTWNSSRGNSYFYRPLGTVLARDDDFSLAFDLRLFDVAIGTTPGKSSTFQLAIGLLNRGNATNAAFLRGTGVDPVSGPRNIVELDYFPDSGFGATISPVVISSNNQFAYSFNFPLELTTNDLFHVLLSYSGADNTLRTTMTRNGQAFGPIQDAVLAPDATDFRLDAVAVMSYSDEGQTPPEYAGSILAHGVLDNFAVTTPEPPVSNLAGAFAGSLQQVQLTSRSNWLYTLEFTRDFRTWTSASPATAGSGAVLVLQDTNAPGDRAFYRVRAERQ